MCGECAGVHDVVLCNMFFPYMMRLAYFLYFLLLCRKVQRLAKKKKIKKNTSWKLVFSSRCRSFGDVGEKSVVPIGVVGNSPDGTVGFDKAVFSFHDFAVSFFFLALLVTRVRIVYAVFVGVSWILVLKNVYSIRIKTQ